MQRVTMKDVAKAASVSRPTVSRALKRDPQISVATTARIRRLADEMGYRRDPAYEVLARQRWGEAQRLRPSVAFLVHADSNMEGYVRGARDCAGRLGYAVNALEMTSYPCDRALARVLEARGIRGLILPIFTERFPAPDLDWRRFAVVACSVDLVHPPFHVVRTNVVRKVEMAWARLRARGYRRIGIALPHEGPNELDFRRMAAARQCLAELPEEDRIPPWCGRFDEQKALPAWLRRHRPEAVIAGQPSVVPYLRKSAPPPGARIPLCCLSPAEGCAHLSSNPERIGYTAMSVLHQQLMENQFGPPEEPFTVVIEPKWVEAEER